jgi:endonuclease/exonuclease/phosphatase (EEP) superfamily protein YafD
MASRDAGFCARVSAALRWVLWRHVPDGANADAEADDEDERGVGDAASLLRRPLLPVGAEAEPVAAGRVFFAVKQFNTLAATLADAFPRADPAVLRWAYRAPLLLAEILQHAPEVVCLEEVDRFAGFFAPALASHGYRGLFARKGGDSRDGCALFYRPPLELRASRKLRYAGASQVAVLARLALAGAEVVVAVTHLKAKQGFEALRARQAAELCDALDAFAGALPCVLAGDLNDTRDSAALRCLAERGRLRDAYGEAHAPWTTFKWRGEEVRRAIDFVLYRPGPQQEQGAEAEGLRLEARLEVPRDAAAAFPDRLPCRAYPSDHLAIMARFSLPRPKRA